MKARTICNHVFNEQTFNFFAAEDKRIARIQWRALEPCYYAVREDSDRFRCWFIMDMVISCDKVFAGKAYKRFTAVFNPTPATRDGNTLFLYAILSHEIAFIANVRKRGADRWNMMIRLHDAPAEEQRRVADEYGAESEAILKKWQLSNQVDFTRYGIIEVEYDPDAMVIRIATKEGLSLDPLDYEHRVSTTSEVLQYVVRSQTQEYATLGNLDHTIESFPLTKLAVDILDKKPIDFDSIRINAADCEQWDYRNPEFEAEIGTHRPK